MYYINGMLATFIFKQCLIEFRISEMPRVKMAKVKSKALFLEHTRTHNILQHCSYFSQSVERIWVDSSISSSILVSHSQSTSSSSFIQQPIVLLHSVTYPLQWNDNNNNIKRCSVNMMTELFVNIWLVFFFFVASSF